MDDSNVATHPLRVWLGAIRPRTLTLALSSIGMGAFLAAADGRFRVVVAALCLLTAVGLQVLSNLANDYGDTRHGADSPARAGPGRAVQTGQVTAATMRRAMGVAALLSAVAGVLLLFVALGQSAWGVLLLFVVLGGAAIWAAVAYTATERPYGYAGLGDAAVFLFFGWVAVLGSYYLQAQRLAWPLLLPATSCGLFAVAVLNVNNIRDIASDRAAGKRSLPVRLGRARARRYHWLLLGGGLLAALLYVWLDAPVQPAAYLFLLSAPLLWRNGRTIAREEIAARLDPMLRQMALTTLIFVITFGVGQLLAA